MVRCSHYPQSPHFLDACDELGLMVWEEPPGWQYLGRRRLAGLVVQNVHDMVIRDRNRPSVIVWGTRLDETANYPTLYARDPPARLRARRHAPDDRRDGHPLHGRLGGGRVRLRRLPLLGTATPSWSRRSAGSPTWSARPSARSTDRRPTAGSTPGHARRAGAAARPGPRHRPVQLRLRRAARLGQLRLRIAERRQPDLAQPEVRRASSTPSGCRSPAPRSTARSWTRGCAR